MITRKHMQALAYALHETKPIHVKGTPTDISAPQWVRDVTAVATVLAQNNPNFDKERFVRACNYGYDRPAPKEGDEEIHH